MSKDNERWYNYVDIYLLLKQYSNNEGLFAVIDAVTEDELQSLLKVGGV
jgi:hypothetical protein